ncbi:MAG: urea transporter [Cyclobacteriaceae bacterium]|nr:urea transporter [Cyclobacteriaceae bacterium]
MANNKENVLAPYLKGIGQIMLQDNSLTGILFLIGILINSPIMALGTVVGTVVSTLGAKLLKYDENDIQNGLYGFNGALVGISMLVFFKSDLMVWGGIVLLSFVSTLMMRQFLTRGLPAFTFPFVLLVWIALYFFHEVVPVEAPSEEDLAGLIDDKVAFNLSGFGFGFGEVIFQGSLVSGLLFLIAVYMGRPLAALYGLAGAFFATLMAVIFIGKFDAVQQGWFTFNAVLVSIALCGEKRTDGIFVLIGVAFAVLIESIMMAQGLIFLTFPFIAAAWITIFLKNKVFAKLIG